MTPLTLPRDAVLHLDRNVVAEVRPAEDGRPLDIAVRPAGKTRRAMPMIAAGAAALVGGLVAGHSVGYSQGAASSEQVAAALSRGPGEAPSRQQPETAEPGTARPPPFARPPATVVRPENRPPQPSADPFGLSR